MEENPYKSPECESETTSVVPVRRRATSDSFWFWIGYVLIQFLAVNLLSPGDCGHWLSIMMPLLAVYNVLLIGFMFAVRKSPLSSGSAVLLLVLISPVFVVILATILLGMA